MRQVLSSVDLSRSIRRLATEILESTQGLEDLRDQGQDVGGRPGSSGRVRLQEVREQPRGGGLDVEGRAPVSVMVPVQELLGIAPREQEHRQRPERIEVRGGRRFARRLLGGPRGGPLPAVGAVGPEADED